MMKQSCRKTLQRLVFLITIVFANLVNAQTLPVQVTPQLIPPHSVKISDYATITNEKLFVNILLTDVNEVGRRVRLKMYIEGQGLSIATLDNVAGAAPIFLDGGINLRLTNLDLQPYFQFNNLTGISPQQYNNPLPNGGYNYCFEVYDYFTGRRISQKSCTTVFLLQNDPPILNLPTRDNIVTATNPQNILFTWTPRHSNLNDVQYEFTLKELWDTQNPQANFLGSIPFYQTITRSTTLLVGPEAPQLISGKVYGWQVRAFVSDGINETSVFKNNGGSEIFWFKYLEDCRPPSFVLSQALTAESVKIEWQLSDHIKYNIQYRKKGFGDDDWFDVNSYTNEGTIFNLEPDTVYEFRVGGECTPLSGYAYSNIQEFTTPSNDEAAYYNCGITPEINIDNQELLPSLKINETFTAGDFPVTPREVSGSNGTFSGWGYITLPFLENLKEIIDAANILTSGEVNIGKYTRIKVEFENVKINTNKQLIEGVVKTTYDPKWGGILDADEIINDILGDDGNISTYDATNMDIDDVIINDNGDIVIIRDTKNDGPNEEFLDDEIVVVSNLPVVITDQNGDQWTVDEEGNITKGEGAEGGQATSSNTNGVSGSGNVNEISSKDVSVKFIPSGFYGTDEYNTKITSSSYKSEYEFIDTHDNKEYSVLYKLISDKPKSTDIIEAEVSFANGKTKKDIVFKTKQGGKVDTTWVGNKVTLKLKKQFDFGKDEIIATVKPKEEDGKYEVAGKLNTWHVKQREINLTLVSINNTPLTGVKERINAIYNKAGVNFSINETSFSMSIGTLDVGNSDMLSNYTDGQKSIIQEFKDKNEVDKDQYYMFFFKDINMTEDLDGFMPLKRQFGFVFKNDDAGSIAAHELGHGIFGLKHPWDQYNDEASKNKTDYLMDYGGGTMFSHMDWQKLHAPGIQIYWFQDDESGEYKNGYLISKILQEIRCKYKSQDYQIDEYLDNFIKRITSPYGNMRESGDYKITLLNYDEGNPTPVKAKIIIGRKESISTLNSTPTTYKEVKNKRVINKSSFDGYEYDLGGIVVWSDFDLKIEGDGSEFANYLANDYTYINVTKENDVEATSDSSQVADNQILEEVVISTITLNSYIKKFIIQDDDISSQEFKILKSIASCDSKSLALDTRFKIIKLISDKWIISEKREDLVLDLLKTTPSKDYDNILLNFQQNPQVYSDFAAGVDDFIEGAENNKDRLYDELFTIWSNSKYYSDPKYHAQDGGTYDPSLKNEEFYREFQKEIEVFILENFDSECLNNHENGNIVDLLICLDIAPTTKIQEISYENRIKILEKILKFGSFANSSFTGTYEKPIIRLLKYLPQNFKYGDFINYLVDTLITIPEGQHGKEVTATVIKLLFDKVNDSVFLFSGDYRKELIEAFIYIKARSIGIEDSVAEIKKGIDNYDIDAVKEKLAFYSYDYRNILKRLFTSLPTPVTPIGSFDFYLSLETELKDGGGTTSAVLNIQQTMKNGVTVESLISEKEHHPFELILFLNLSKQPLLSDFSVANQAGEKSASMVPAIVAHYASVEGDNQTRADIIQTAIDVGTLALPGGQVRGIGRLFYYADKISSLASMAGTYNREENPRLASIFNKISMATGLISMGDLAQTGYKTLLKNKRANLDKLTAGEIADNLVDQTEEILDILNKYPEELDNILKQDNSKIDELANILEKEKEALGKGISDSQARKVDEVVERLREFTKGNKIPSEYITKAEQLINDLKPIEPTVTADLEKFAESIGGKMEGLEFRMKTVESLARKLLNDGINTTMYDILRYTTSINEANFTDKVFEMVKKLQNEGYTLDWVSNSFKEGSIYKGINMTFTTPSGKVFELQFHTPKSFDVKQNINHSLYEQYRKLDPTSDEAIQLAEKMKNNSKDISHPKDVEKISLYNFKTNQVEDFLNLLDQKGLLNKYNNLPSQELKDLFRNDFINSTDEVLESLKNDDAFEFWLNYRKNNPTTPSCK
ncbi:MAG: fibronectin type III domain-containing protein [Tenacibaculum sp.]|nr:fibronectin type III domain-containing protein [Tenacibaculum sp.]